ncbi:hypothetical protein RIR_jg21868.t1 [Rhizophagus irregularis DAOM 181602=DAOM 197198]|uniref:Uncharacterized protein n=1 Tax=Rhizophagus irregularis (strain DAOM 181602 / DAOM 197198 / MUCL 43194) TaxID=747089 RepID=U9TAF9_RHIID|nr:hypothetical protein RIR_jg21868.t1 [Rhizophagus irregularis DAOM 181602=DAOM 197198]
MVLAPKFTFIRPWLIKKIRYQGIYLICITEYKQHNDLLGFISGKMLTLLPLYNLLKGHRKKTEKYLTLFKSVKKL